MTCSLKCIIQTPRIKINKHPYFSPFQKDVIAESADILKLGLLFGEDVDATTIDFPEVLSFQHKLIQEYLAAIYITENLKLDPPERVLADALSTWEKIGNHREVVLFACGMLATTDASPLTNHVAKVLSELIQKQINEGEDLSNISYSSVGISLLHAFQKEAGTPLTSPYICEYPRCGRPLAEVLAHTKLAVITDVDKNDALQINASIGQIILDIEGMSGKLFESMWQALHSVPVANVTALYLYEVKIANRANLRHFSQLKHLSMQDADVSELEDLVLSINSWGPQPLLTFCGIWGEQQKIPTALVTALTKCTHLRDLSLLELNLHDTLSILMASPPPELRELVLHDCNLNAEDINYMTQAIREDRLTKLKELNIESNPIGEAALDSMLEVISVRRHSIKRLRLGCTCLNEAGEQHFLPEQFVNKWKTKLTTIDVKWD